MTFSPTFMLIFIIFSSIFFTSIIGSISSGPYKNPFKDVDEVEGDAKSLPSNPKLTNEIDNTEAMPTEEETCSAPGDVIGFIVENIENGVIDTAINHNVNYQLSRPHIGTCACSDKLVKKIFYQSQETSSVYDTEAIRVLCAGNFTNFCACDIDGMCFKQAEPITYAEIQPYCEEEGCFAYLELYRGSIVGPQDQRAISVKYEGLGGSPDFGISSPYMKVAAVSCNGCERIQQASCAGQYREML